MTVLSPTTTMILMSMIHLLVLLSALKVLTDSLAGKERTRDDSPFSNNDDNDFDADDTSTGTFLCFEGSD